MNLQTSLFFEFTENLKYSKPKLSLMNKNTALMLASVVFALAALLHLSRIVFGWKITIGNFEFPVYLSGLAVIVAGFLSWKMYSLSK